MLSLYIFDNSIVGTWEKDIWTLNVSIRNTKRCQLSHKAFSNLTIYMRVFLSNIKYVNGMLKNNN